MMVRISLGTARQRTGRLYVMNDTGAVVFGPVAVAGCADQASALSKGNPNRDPTRLYGDTPTGEYSVTAVVSAHSVDGYDYPAYGTGGVIVLEPTEGQAAAAKAQGRTMFLIHGGSTSLSGLLYATSGSLRLHDSDQRQLVDLVKVGDSVSVAIDSEPSTLEECVDIEGPFEYQDPPLFAARGARVETHAAVLAHVPSALGQVMFTGSTGVAQSVSNTAYSANDVGQRGTEAGLEFGTVFVTQYQPSQQLTAYSAVGDQTLRPGASNVKTNTGLEFGTVFVTQYQSSQPLTAYSAVGEQTLRPSATQLRTDDTAFY